MGICFSPRVFRVASYFYFGGSGIIVGTGFALPWAVAAADAFQVYGEQAAHLVFGVVPMLVIAGIIEGFISPSPIVPDILKYGIGVALFVGLLKYGERRKPGV